MEKVSEPNRQLISDEFSAYLADLYALYLKTQNCHWNVTGAEFFSLHLLFEKQYQEMEEEIDEVAERIRALGFFVAASFDSFKKLMKIKEGEKVLTAKDMLQALIAGHEILIARGRGLSKLAEKEQDFATVDLVGKSMRDHEKMAWMLRSQL